LEVSTPRNRLILVLVLGASLLSLFLSPWVLRGGLSFEAQREEVIRKEGFPALVLELNELNTLNVQIAQALFFGGFIGFVLSAYTWTIKYYVEEKELMGVFIVALVVVYLINSGMIQAGFQRLFA